MQILLKGFMEFCFKILWYPNQIQITSFNARFPKNGVAKHERLFYLTPNTMGSHLDYIYNAALQIWTSQNKTL